ncbi:MAG: V-type ATPase subunit [Candidatus Anstonellaceae archaeon]
MIGYGNIIGAVRSRLTFLPLIYGYSNARVRAMRTSLLSRRQAEDLLKLHSSAAMAEYLTRLHFREDFSGLSPKMNDEERVETAVGRNFARTAQKLLRITPEQSKPTLRAFLGRYDVHNIKTILLGRKLGKQKQETEFLLIPAGSITPAELSRMLSAKSSEELYESIRTTEFGSRFISSKSASHLPRQKIKEALASPHANGEMIDSLLLALDSYYFEVAASAVKPNEKDADIILNLLRAEADVKNALTIMRLKRGKADKRVIMKNLVSGGNFTKHQLEKMAEAKEVSEIPKLAPGFFVSEAGKAAFAEAEKRYKEDGQLSHFEVAFEGSLARRSLHALHRSMMSIGTIVGFLFLKEEEMNNIRKVLRGRALGLPMEKIAEMLVLAG